MATMPPVHLGAILLIAFGLNLAVRAPVEKAFVLGVDDASQSKRQFFMDMGLCLLAGIAASLYNTFVLEFPMASSISLLFGCAVAGFFMSMDTALARERQVIQHAIDQELVLPPPKLLYSVTRKFSLVSLTGVLFFTIVFVLVFSRDIIWLSTIGTDPQALRRAQLTVAYEIIFVMAVLLGLVSNLIVSYSKNLRLLFASETDVLERVSNGDLTKKVPIATHDEFGFIAGHTNTMIDGLRHRMELLDALKLAEEIQQNLLPQASPRHDGLDISGVSVYCEEIGGDYYDFFDLSGQRLAVVVADAAGHGISAAMDMTATRAFLHHAIKSYEGPASLIGILNDHLSRDSRKTGRFVSLFFMEIDTGAKTLAWVRAGHEPAQLFDPATRKFNTLSGEGLALGVKEAFDYQAYTLKGWTPGSVLVIGTDGLHETRNAEDEMFGVQRLQALIRDHSHLPAAGIQEAVIARILQFRGGLTQDDDLTLVVIKLL